MDEITLHAYTELIFLLKFVSYGTLPLQLLLGGSGSSLFLSVEQVNPPFFITQFPAHYLG